MRLGVLIASDRATPIQFLTKSSFTDWDLLVKVNSGYPLWSLSNAF
ncbi:MAG: hypothetical protein HC773_32580 [Scytonema sp. CRU_2_7]|nr:hypothetical protein [Scytonema sp. CRU_2_7]